MGLVDSHCHLDFPDFENDLEAVIHRAGEAGVDYMVTICTHVTRFDRVLALAKQFQNVWCSVGIHPHNVEAEPEISTEQLISISKHPKVVAIGETGLDFYYNNSKRDRQESQFRTHIRAARATGLPIIIHTRDADADTIRILRDEHDKGSFPGLIHCFSSSLKMAKVAIDLGLYISISGIVTFKNASDLRNTVKDVPLERLLVETDSPYLAPVPERGKRNEPAFTAHTAKAIAAIKGLDNGIVAKETTNNFFRLFTKTVRL
ncbi:MAG: LuxR family transcriptional regulator [Rhodospirillaceae bacterium TMED8]|nr:LuxR family transcriptional regulator [Magnetovibrio sp.]OUT52031.1 MAG: LuxR family transcriptional regulator [Rhodospirillaceae bacterium TMED8]|tara:strand:- start:967 stop:1749 length:783 start_codon:yes stop_codon:yes gene_type:complete